MDRTVCDGPLSKGGFIRGEPDGFAILERWFLRLGYFTRREAGPAVLQGNLVVMPYPRRAVSARFCKLVSDYVNAGGKLLVLDSPENTGSTANNLIEPFGMKIERDTNEQGPLVPPPSWPTGVLIEAACKVSGGDPFMTVNGRPVAAQKRYGQGTVTVIGFGSKFSDLKMGVTGDVRPEAALRKIFDLDFALMRWIVEGRITTQPATATASMPAQP